MEATATNWIGHFFSKPGARRLKIDACAGDAVVPNIVTANEAFLLPIGTNNIELRVYPKEFVIAEKLETIARFRTGNTRCKDFIDIWMLIQTGVDLQAVSEALRMCFSNAGLLSPFKPSATSSPIRPFKTDLRRIESAISLSYMFQT
jgi:hypothetical protein